MQRISAFIKEPLVIKQEDSKERIRIDYSIVHKALLTLKAINHPLRKKILTLLTHKKKLAVAIIYEKLHVQETLVSHQLSILRNAGLVKSEKEGKHVFYSLNPARLEQVNSIIVQLA